jgi:choline dehydrogenase-like flavoprotein
MLSDKFDELGMPRAKLDWRLSEIEEFSVRRYMALFENEWRRFNLGRIEWRSEIHEPGAIRSLCHDTFHQAGTTRMSTDPTRGVVDTDLMVHGCRNLFIGSCSVFPTSGSSNPTLTMMALCFRLADHLKRVLAPSAVGIPISPKT